MGVCTAVQTFVRTVAALAILTFSLVGCSTQSPPAPEPTQGVLGARATATVPGPGESATAEPVGAETPAPPRSTAPPLSPEVDSEPTPEEIEATRTAPASPFPFFELDSYSLRPGDTVVLRGGGFQPGERVRVYLGSSPRDTLAEARADEAGEFTVADLQIPAAEGADRTVVVEGVSSRLRVERRISSVAYHPWVVLDRYAVKPGESIGFSGFAFAPGERVCVYLDDVTTAPLAEVAANDRGEVGLQQLLTPEPTDVGNHRLIFVGRSTGSNLVVAFEVLGYTPVMELTSYSGRPGALVAFEGKGFAPGESIRAYTGTGRSRTEVSSFLASPQGDFSHAGEFRVPTDAPSGPLPVTLEGSVSKTSVGQTFGVEELSPWAGLSSYSGPSGSRVTVRVEGFGGNEPVNLHHGGTRQKLATGQTDSLGAAEVGSVVIPIPEEGAESIVFLLRGELTGAEAVVEFDVNE